VITENSTQFESGGRQITVERYEPGTPGQHPALLILHGREGLQGGGFIYRMLAAELAQHGYAAYVVGYYDRTGTRFSLSPETEAETHRRNFEAWMGAIQDALGWVGRQPGVDPARLGLVGVSLGAYLALSVAALDTRVRAVVELFGGLPDELADRLESMPPILILHGEADRTVPVSEARKLEQLLKERGFPHEAKIYPGQGHGFNGTVLFDVRERALAFLGKYLGSGLTRPEASASSAPSGAPTPR